jgi:hypothetical protein
MALTSPGLVLSIDALFGFIRPPVRKLARLGATDFSADAPGIDIKPGATIKSPSTPSPPHRNTMRPPTTI